jgi:hypothetical protein
MNNHLGSFFSPSIVQKLISFPLKRHHFFKNTKIPNEKELILFSCINVLMAVSIEVVLFHSLQKNILFFIFIHTLAMCGKKVVKIY